MKFICDIKGHEARREPSTGITAYVSGRWVCKHCNKPAAVFIHPNKPDLTFEWE